VPDHASATARLKEARSIVGQVLRSLGLEHRVRGFQAGESWAEIVGPVLAARSSVVDFKDGKLTVEVLAAPAMVELQLRSEELLRGFAERHGDGLIREIRFVPGAR
jgi:predicted nucleic acid-binding Zn ribbon protein